MTSPRSRVAWPVRTPRLSLRPAVPADAEATWRYRSDPAVTRWMTREDADHDAYVERHSAPEFGERTLVIQVDDQVVGDLYLSIEDAWAQAEVKEQAVATQAEIGWCLAPEHTGRGLAREAVRELIRICFEDLGLRRLTANCFVANEPSWRMMEDLGMRREAHNVRDSLHREGGWMDGYTYALLADEWAPHEA